MHKVDTNFCFHQVTGRCHTYQCRCDIVLNLYPPLGIRCTSRVTLIALQPLWATKTSLYVPLLQCFDFKQLHHYSNSSITEVMRTATSKEKSCWVESYTGNRRGSTVFLPCSLASLWFLVCELKHMPTTSQSNFVGEHPTGRTVTRRSQKENILLGLFQSTLS